MSPEQLSQNILKIAEQTIYDCITELWSDQGPIAASLKGQFSIAANYILPGLSLEFLQKITTHEQLDLINNYLTMQEKSQTSVEDELAKLAELWGIEDTQAKTKVAIVSEQLAVLLTNPANAKNLLELKDSVLESFLGVTDEQLVKLAAGEYDDFFILQESYGKPAIINSDAIKDGSYILCNSVYDKYLDVASNVDDSSPQIALRIYKILVCINGITRALLRTYEKSEEHSPSNQAANSQLISSFLQELQESIETNEDHDFRNLASQTKQRLDELLSIFTKDLEPLRKLNSSLQKFTDEYKKLLPSSYDDGHQDDFQNQSFYFINELITPSNIQQVWLKNLQADQPAIATNQDLRTFTQGLYSRPASLISLANENAFLLDIIADREEAVKEKFSNAQAKIDLKNLSHLKTLILNHNKSLIKQALPAKAWQEYLGLDNPVYLESVLDKLCQNATPEDVIKFIQLADEYRGQTLPKFIKALVHQNFTPNFLNDFMQAPEAVAIFNSDIAKLDQKLLKARNKVDRLQHPQPGLMDRLLGKEPKINKPKLENAKQTVSALTTDRIVLKANALGKRLSFMQRAFQFVPKLFKRLGARFNPSQTSLALPHPMLQQVTVNTFNELASLENKSDKIAQLSNIQLLNLLDHRLLVTHASRDNSENNLKNEITTALRQRFKEHPNFFTPEFKAIYDLKMSLVTSQELLQLITDHKANPYVLRHISSDALEQFFQDEKLDISPKLQVAELLRQIHPTLCQDNIKALRAQLVTSQAQKDHRPTVVKNDVEPSKTIEFTRKPWGFFAKILTAKDKKEVMVRVPTQDPTTQQSLPHNPQHVEEAILEKVNKMGGFSYIKGPSN